MLCYSFFFLEILWLRNVSPHSVSYCLHSHYSRMWSRGIGRMKSQLLSTLCHLYCINTKRASGLFIFSSSSISAHLVFHVSVGHVCVNQGWGPAVVWTGGKHGWKRRAGLEIRDRRGTKRWVRKDKRRSTISTFFKKKITIKTPINTKKRSFTLNDRLIKYYKDLTIKIINYS